MNRRLAEAVIATFREYDGADPYSRLAPFRDREWRRGLRWLDASGLALYFLTRLKKLGLEEVLPPDVLSALECRFADNKKRNDCLFDEFLPINRAFQAAGVSYVNLKGFTLVPDYCPDPALRCQFDLDFLVADRGVREATDILTTFGYEMTGRGDNVLEFKAGSAQLPSISELYKWRPNRSVELHLVSMSGAAAGFSADVFLRSRSRYWRKCSFPALSDADAFLAQANHLLRHVRSEWTRVSWLLEFKTFVSSRYGDSAFWCYVQTQAKTSPNAVLSIGVALWLTTEAFGHFAPPSVMAWSVDKLPPGVRLWLERCGATLLVGDFPGTKLYLLLNKELSPHDAAGGRDTLRRLFPLHRPPQVTTSKNIGLRQQGHAVFAQFKYILFRLRFHLVATWQYLLEARRWKKMTGSLQPVTVSSAATTVDISLATAVDR